MSKMTDKKCQDCTNYNNCDKDSSAGCDSYEYYKCKDCVDRVTETDDCPRCFRGGKPCSHVRLGGIDENTGRIVTCILYRKADNVRLTQEGIR